jgi:DNA-binding NtrC family response regulator
MRAHRDDIDTVLLDVTLPGGVSSRDLFEEVLRMRPVVKVIVTSAYGKEAVCASFAGLRVDYFIRKPFEFDDLASVLGDALSAKANAG